MSNYAKQPRIYLYLLFTFCFGHFLAINLFLDLDFISSSILGWWSIDLLLDLVVVFSIGGVS